MPLPPPKNPQKSLERALTAHNFAATNRCISHVPAILEGSLAWRTTLTMAALGRMGEPVEKKRAGWDWLAERAFEFPTDVPPEGDGGFVEVLGKILESEPIELATLWRERAPDLPLPSHLLGRALWRRDTEALQWWVDQGLPLEEPAQVMHPVMGQPRQPNVLLSITIHKFNALPHVQFLLDHGAEPLKMVNPQEPHVKLDSPLIAITRRYKDKDNVGSFPVDPEEVEQFRALWVALVAAGDDPAYQSDLKECPLDLLQQTRSAGWWESHLRHSQTAPLTTEPTRQRMRRRS